MHNIFIGRQIINIEGLTEAELEKLQRDLELALDDVDEAMNRDVEGQSLGLPSVET